MSGVPLVDGQGVFVSLFCFAGTNLGANFDTQKCTKARYAAWPLCVCPLKSDFFILPGASRLCRSALGLVLTQSRVVLGENIAPHSTVWSALQQTHDFVQVSGALSRAPSVLLDTTMSSSDDHRARAFWDDVQRATGARRAPWETFAAIFMVRSRSIPLEAAQVYTPVAATTISRIQSLHELRRWHQDSGRSSRVVELGITVHTGASCMYYYSSGSVVSTSSGFATLRYRAPADFGAGNLVFVCPTSSLICPSSDLPSPHGCACRLTCDGTTLLRSIVLRRSPRWKWYCVMPLIGEPQPVQQQARM